ncbi:MAG: ABC transporter ATP-binding protein/permease [Verrucomicrobiota bacterium]
MPAAPKFNRHSWVQLWKISKAYYAGPKRKVAWLMFGGLITLSLIVAGVGVIANAANGAFFTSLEQGDEEGYYRALWVYLATFLASIPCAAFYKYIEERLALHWREDLARNLMRRYFHNRAYYHLAASDEIDNPDQRISEDVRNFTTTTLSFVLIFMNSMIQAAAYTGVLWSISKTVVGVLYGYAIGGTVIALLIGKRLVGLNYHQYEREANLRHGLIRVRDHSESIAFYRGERREFRDLRWRLGEAVGNMVSLIKWNRNLAFFTTGYNSVALILPVILVAPLFLRGEVQFGDIARTVGAFSVVLAAVSLIITQFERLSAFAAGVTRLGALWENLDERDEEEDLESDEERIETQDNERVIELEDLTVRTPDGGRELLRDLSLKVPTGTSLLIMGPSGSGKSSLLRTIAGLWTTGSGSISRPPYRELMFLPQRPYVNMGTLRGQLEYPGKSGMIPDDQLSEILKVVNLVEILERVDGDFDRRVDWGAILSLGEQQRLSFARLFLRKPSIAFLDESTSALDEENETRLYELMRRHKQTFLSVGHRSTLRKHHDWMLEMDKVGKWKLTPLPKGGG